MLFHAKMNKEYLQMQPSHVPFDLKKVPSLLAINCQVSSISQKHGEKEEKRNVF